MGGREALAWTLLGIVAVFVAVHWSAAKAAWKYREQLGQAGDVIDGLQQAGVLK
jgi:hypothetical protein